MRILALGGITAENAGGLQGSGAYGLAAIGGLAEAFAP
jgi:thiamine monophosphate synthase